MRVVVTGGAGFIGSHLVDALVEAGHEVFVIDDLSSGRRDRLPDGVRLEVADVRSREAAALVEDVRPDGLMHLAAQIDVRRSVEDPRFDADVNVGGSLNLLEAAVRAGVGRVVFASTGGAIYGEQEAFPADEHHPQRPVSPYGCAKSAVETYLGFYRAQYGLSSVALRYANVYGPRQDPHGEAGVVAIFCGLMGAGAPCTLYGEGRLTRDYVFVGDVVRANLLALGSDYQGSVNVGTGVETEVRVLHDRLADAAGHAVPPLLAPARPGEQARSVIDPALAGRVLGWSPQVGLDEGLARTWAWFSAQAPEA